MIESQTIKEAYRYRKQITGIRTYSDLTELDKDVITSLTELETSLICKYEEEFEGSWGAPPELHTGGHHTDTLNVLQSAYKNYNWDTAGSSTIFQFDTDYGEGFISYFLESFSSRLSDTKIND